MGSEWQAEKGGGGGGPWARWVVEALEGEGIVKIGCNYTGGGERVARAKVRPLSLVQLLGGWVPVFCPLLPVIVVQSGGGGNCFGVSDRENV